MTEELIINIEEAQPINISMEAGVGVTSFVGLSDVPNIIEPLKFLRGDATGNALEFVDSSASIAWGGITGTLSEQIDLQAELDLKANTASLATIAISGDYYDLINTPIIPSKTSDLTNDSLVESIVAGTNISVDNTDPLNPIISASVNSAVDSVNGQTGTVVLDSDDISEGSINMYLTGNEFQKTVDTLDDISDGATYVKSTNDYTDTEKTKLSGIEEGAEVNNISDTNATDLTDLGDSSLHYHISDRDRANHTGTQTASTISDFDTEVSNNTDVTANTSSRHDAVTVSDSNEINFTLTGQQITASLVAGSIDETKLDTSVNASLDLADSAVQNLSDLGITATSTELNYVDGVTSSIQTQIDSKLTTDGAVKITVGTTQPTSPSTGDIWIDTN